VEFAIRFVLIYPRPNERKDATLEGETSQNFENRFENVEAARKQTIQQGLTQQLQLLFLASKNVKIN
jgi:hypothetical protein